MRNKGQQQQGLNGGEHAGQPLFAVFLTGKSNKSQRIWRVLGIFLLCSGLFFASACTKVAVIPEAEETVYNWSQARDYQAQGRYELARQHYLLALAAARTAESQQTLQRELDSVDRMLEALR